MARGGCRFGAGRPRVRRPDSIQVWFRVPGPVADALGTREPLALREKLLELLRAARADLQWGPVAGCPLSVVGAAENRQPKTDNPEVIDG